MSEPDKAITDLLSKGDGVLTKRGTVWTYPGCPNDQSGTNLVLPVDYVSDVEVQKAMADGSLHAAVMSPTGVVSSVRLASDEMPVLQAALAGSAEMGTELPLNSRVESDAGTKPTTSAQAEAQATEALKAVMTPAPKPAEPKAPAPANKAKP